MAKMDLKAQRRKCCCFTYVGWFSLAQQKLEADVDAPKVPGSKQHRGRRAASAEETGCCEQQGDKTSHLIETGNQRKVYLDCYKGSERCRERGCMRSFLPMHVVTPAPSHGAGG